MKWKPSRTKAREFAKQMEEINTFCVENNISTSRSNDSYYFTINKVNYRVSNHTIEKSNASATDWMGNVIREKYHDARKDDTIYIHASKTRIIEIYNDLKNGYDLDGRGNRKC